MSTRSVLALIAMIGVLSALPASARAQSAAGQATAAIVNTAASGSQTFAAATLPTAGGMTSADADAASVANVLGADGLRSIATGQLDDALASVTASAETANLNLLNGLITAKAVVALATSYATGATAASEANGSTLLGLVVNGVAYDDGAPTPNTRINLPGVGFVVLNEQVAQGDGIHTSALTVNMIHVYLTDALTGSATGEIIVGSAQSSASR